MDATKPLESKPHLATRKELEQLGCNRSPATSAQWRAQVHEQHRLAREEEARLAQEAEAPAAVRNP